MDEKSIRNSQKVLLSILIQHANSSLQNSIFALIQRLIINTPDRVDDRKNTVDVIVKISLAFNESNKQRLNQWLCTCSRCNIANIRLGVIAILRELLMSTYARDSAVYHQEQQPAENGEEGGGGKDQGDDGTALQWMNSEKGMEVEGDDDDQDDDQIQSSTSGRRRKRKQRMDDDDEDDEYNNHDGTMNANPSVSTKQRGGVRRQLFLEEEPLVPLFMGIIIGRCNDIVITVRTEAVHVCQNTVYFWNSKNVTHFIYRVFPYFFSILKPTLHPSLRRPSLQNLPLRFSITSQND